MLNIVKEDAWFCYVWKRQWTTDSSYHLSEIYNSCLISHHSGKRMFVQVVISIMNAIFIWEQTKATLFYE